MKKQKQQKIAGIAEVMQAIDFTKVYHIKLTMNLKSGQELVFDSDGNKVYVAKNVNNK